jgi:hypothetical protein
MWIIFHLLNIELKHIDIGTITNDRYLFDHSIYHKRLNIFTENDFESKNFNKNLIKKLDSECQYFATLNTQVPSCKNDTDFYQKIEILPFQTCFADYANTDKWHKKSDPSIRYKLLENNDACTALFTWLVDCAIKSMNQQITVPIRVINAKNNYLVSEGFYNEDI